MSGIRTTNWSNMNRCRTIKPPPQPQIDNKKRRIVWNVLRRYDLWHNGVIVKSLRKIGDTKVTHIVISETYTLSNLMNAVAMNDRDRIKQVIDERINLRGQRKCIDR